MTTVEAISVCLSAVALVVSVVAAIYSRRPTTLDAGRDTAALKLAGEALVLERERRASEWARQREELLSRLTKEAIDGWKEHWSAAHILDREESRTEAEQKRFIRQIYRALQRTDAQADHWLGEYRKARPGSLFAARMRERLM